MCNTSVIEKVDLSNRVTYRDVVLGMSVGQSLRFNLKQGNYARVIASTASKMSDRKYTSALDSTKTEVILTRVK